MLGLSRDLYKSLISNELDDILNPEHIKTLGNRGFIVPQNSDEVDIIRKNKEIYIRDVTAIGLQILPTLYCNFSCPYCYEQLPTHFETMSQELMDAIVAHLEQKIKPTTRFLSVMWFGGEPLLAMDCIQYLSNRFLSLSKKHSIEYNSAITTNGYLLNEENSRILIENKVKTYQVTLDGPAHIHDQRRMLKNGGKTWNTIVKNLKHITSAEMKVTIRMNVDKTNIHSVEELIEDLKKYGLMENVRMSLGVVKNQGNACRGFEDTLLTASEISEFVKQRDWETLLRNDPVQKFKLVKPDFIGCVATARNSVIVGPKGELYKCPKVIGVPEETCGSIFQYHENDNFLKWELCDNLDNESCRVCSMLPICDGLGCSYDFTIQKENIFKCDQPQFHRNYIKQLIQYYRQKCFQPK
jgi:uncharacterized protein